MGESGHGPGSLDQSHPWGKGGVVSFREEVMYPPYWKNKCLAIPFNRSIVLGPYEVRGFNLPCVFLVETIRECF